MGSIERTEINVVMVGFGPARLDFSSWEEEIGRHPKSMLPAAADALEKSYDAGDAALLLNDKGEIRGGVRFTPLLDKKLIQEMGLPEDTPEIVEMGSIVTMGEARGNGYTLQLNQTLIDSALQKIAEKKLLIIGTTKTIFLLRTLVKLQGVQFSEHSHDEFPMIEPLTCVCKGVMGSGCQISAECPSRIKPDQVAKLKNGLVDKAGAIPCTLFVSDAKLAHSVDGVLRDRFSRDNLLNPQQAEVEFLKDKEYYK